MKSKLIITISTVMFFISCADTESFEKYEGTYVLNTNNNDTLILKDIRINEFQNFYYGHYERRIKISDSTLVMKSTFVYDIAMENLEFDNWRLITNKENSDRNYYHFISNDNNRTYVKMDWYENLWGQQFVECDLDGILYYKKINY